MSEKIPSDKGLDTVSLADEEGVKRILLDTMFGLWAISQIPSFFSVS
jgi:hypothetical protein